jgi:hypothetical protein
LIASFHIVEYRKRVFAPPKQPAGRVEGLRFWGAFNVGGDFAWFREHPSRWRLYPRLRPDFRRWAFYAVWDDDAALDEFMTGSETACAWRHASVQTCHLWLRPNRVRGPWQGMQVLRGFEGPGQPTGPVACIARADLSPRGMLAFWGSAAPHILQHLPDDEEMLLALPLVDRPYAQPVAFSVWRNADSAMTFVHREGGHRDAVQRMARSQHDFRARHSSGHFEAYRCEGSWNGRQPLTQASITGPLPPTGPDRRSLTRDWR